MSQKDRLKFLVTIAVFIFSIVALRAESGTNVTSRKPCSLSNLRCENQENPIGIDAMKPRLSWLMQSLAHGQRQRAYRVLVASSEALLQQGEGALRVHLRPDQQPLAARKQPSYPECHNSAQYHSNRVCAGQRCIQCH